MNPSRLRTSKLLILAGMLASALHFADNTFAIARYPEPSWITPFGVAASWFIVMPLALMALTRKSADGVFFATAGIYALWLLSGLLHYAFGPPMQMAVRSHLTVLAEALAGAALASALLLSARPSRETAARYGAPRDGSPPP
jgi:hypothetical protein